jgi:hypothetical protein
MASYVTYHRIVNRDQNLWIGCAISTGESDKRSGYAAPSSYCNLTARQVKLGGSDTVRNMETNMLKSNEVIAAGSRCWNRECDLFGIWRTGQQWILE